MCCSMLQTLHFLILKKAKPEKSIVNAFTLGMHQYKGPYSQGSFALYHAIYICSSVHTYIIHSFETLAKDIMPEYLCFNLGDASPCASPYTLHIQEMAQPTARMDASTTNVAEGQI